jgi:hypothetical protein
MEITARLSLLRCNTLAIEERLDREIVDFYDPADGSQTISSITVQRAGDRVSIPFPDFRDAIAFKMMVLR